LTVSASSTGNQCFVNGYNSQIPVINAIFWSCTATLQGGQSIKQNIFRSPELSGPFTLTVTASDAVTVVVFVNGVQVFSQTGTSISFTTGNATPDEPMYVTITNSQATTATSYTLSIDWTGV